MSFSAHGHHAVDTGVQECTALRDGHQDKTGLSHPGRGCRPVDGRGPREPPSRPSGVCPSLRSTRSNFVGGGSWTRRGGNAQELYTGFRRQQRQERPRNRAPPQLQRRHYSLCGGDCRPPGLATGFSAWRMIAPASCDARATTVTFTGLIRSASPHSRMARTLSSAAARDRRSAIVRVAGALALAAFAAASASLLARATFSFYRATSRAASEGTQFRIAPPATGRPKHFAQRAVSCSSGPQ